MNDQDRLDIEAVLGGDQQAYRNLIERYDTTISRLIWRFSRDPGTCEELVEETFVEAYMSLGNYRHQGTFEAWIKCIATRVGYRYWKNRNKHSQTVGLDDMIDPEAPPERADPDVVHDITMRLLDRLNPSDRLVLTLMYFDQCSTEEIARRMDWTRGMVKMRAFRARRKLKTIVEKEHLLDDVSWTP